MAIGVFNTREDPLLGSTRTSEHYWDEAIEWAGAKQVGIGRRILERFRWWELQAAPDRIEPHASPDGWHRPFAASLPDGTLLCYLPGQSMQVESYGFSKPRITLTGLGKGKKYSAVFTNPRTGAEHAAIVFDPKDGRQELKGLDPENPNREAPTLEDWVLIVRPVGRTDSVSAEAWTEELS
jgi:hypothetical protein